MAAEALPYENPDPFDLDSPPDLKVLTPADGLPPIIGPEYWAQFAAKNQAKREKFRATQALFDEHQEHGAKRVELFKSLKKLAKPEEGQAKEFSTFTFNDGSVIEGICTAVILPYRPGSISLNPILSHVVICSPSQALEAEFEIRDIAGVAPAA